MEKSENTLYETEEITIDEAEGVLKDEQYHGSPLFSKYAYLLQQYKNMFKQLRRLIRLSDKQQEKLNNLNNKLEIANNLIRKTFGRYLSDDVVKGILSSEGLVLGGETRIVTILMSDLRGFTAISESLPAETVMNIINIYLSKMTDIIMRYNGTIIEFIGDSIFVVFGAPVFRSDDAQQATACAIEMQRAMGDVNRECRERGYPEVEQGIGLNTGELVVGNIGSDKRTKYGAVGKNVNLTARVESYTLGGQIFISESTLKACGSILKIVACQEVHPKGIRTPIKIYEVCGIEGDFNLYLPEKAPENMTEITSGLGVRISVLEGKHAGDETIEGEIIRLSARSAVIRSNMKAERFGNLKLALIGSDGREMEDDLYVKVTESPAESSSTFKVYFTSIPLKIRDFLQKTYLDAI
ncbi:MAG: adenylate/guanylate cyclase domain-containing protein [Candidatus Riflebacteria bacterium]|nr:adenylate/guanylate cyclase domain-containing protein [Candidatus Riflebacteria bacterium]